RRRGPVAPPPARDGRGQAGAPAPPAPVLLRGPVARSGQGHPAHLAVRVERVPARGPEGVPAAAQLSALRALRGAPARLLPAQLATGGGNAAPYRGQRRLPLARAQALPGGHAAHVGHGGGPLPGGVRRASAPQTARDL